jgi:hypothetical protein
MPGFRLVGTDAERQAKYLVLVEERANRQKADHEPVVGSALQPQQPPHPQ